jgi:hypothetical protein
MTSRHVRPAIADQRAVLATALAVLASDPEAAHQAAVPSGTCPACVVIASIQLGYALCASLAGQPFVTPELAARLAGMVEHARAELGGGAN